MMSKKMLKGLCAILALSTVLTACAGSGGGTPAADAGGTPAGAGTAEPTGGGKDGYTIGFVSASFSDEYCKRLADAFVAQTDQFEDVTVTALNGNGDVAQIISCIETFKSQGVDALIVQPIGNVPDACLWANEKDVPLVFVNIKPVLSDTTKDLKYYYVGSSEEAIGAQEAEAISEGLDQGAKVCLLMLPLGQDNQVYRTKGFEEWMAANRPDIQIIDKQAGTSTDSAQAMSITEDWIQRFGVDGIDAIATQGSSMTIGTVEAVRSHNALDKIKIADIGIPPTMEWLLNNEIYCSLYQDPQAEAYGAVEAAYQMLTGKESEIKCDIPEENWIVINMTTVTTENVNDVLATIKT